MKRQSPLFLKEKREKREERLAPAPKLAPTKLASQPPSSLHKCSRIIFHSKKAEDNNNKSTQPPPPPTMKFKNVNLLLSTSAAVIATAPLVSGQVSFVHSIVYLLGTCMSRVEPSRVYQSSLIDHLLIFLHNLTGHSLSRPVGS